MDLPRSFFGFVLALVAVGLLAWVLVFYRNEPSYQGKRLSDWARDYGSNHWSSSQEKAKPAQAASQHIGADGVVIPWVESADQLRDAVAFAHYPPDGVRGIGAERATCWGQCFVEHAQEANENVFVIPIIESVRGGRNIRELLRVEGVDLFWFGPADFSSSAGFRGQWEGPGVAEQIRYIQYDRQLEFLYPVCEEGWVEEPGECPDEGMAGCNVPALRVGGLGVLAALALLRRRRA